MTTKKNRRDFLKQALVTGAAGVGAFAASAGLGPEEAGGPSVAHAAGEGEKPAERVPRKALGGTGQEIPILVMGCAQRFNPRYDKMLHRAFKEGVDYLDTALVYARGESHRTLAPFIKQVGRKRLWITSKAPHRRNRATADTYRRDLATCLRQLEVDQLDLFFMHQINDAKYVSKEYLQMGETLKKEGKIRFFGFSCHDGNVVDLMSKAAALGGIDAIMFRYNFGEYGNKALNRAIDACKKAKIGLIAMKTQRSVPPSSEKVVQFKSKHFSLPQAKLKAVWADERIDSAVSHMDNLEKLKENVAAAKSPIRIGMHEMQQLQRLAAHTASHSCTGCSHLCEPKVAAKTKVADALRFLMYAECYGEAEKARELFGALTPAERTIRGVDFSAASAACPEGIDIGSRLAYAQELLA